MNDLPSMASRLRETRPFQRGEVERKCGCRKTQPRAQFAGGQTGRALGNQHAHQIQSGFLCDGGECGSGF